MRRLAQGAGHRGHVALPLRPRQGRHPGRHGRPGHRRDPADRCGRGTGRAPSGRRPSPSSRSLAAHPWAASTILSVKQASEPRIRYMDWILGTLRRAGFSEDVTDLGYHALESHIMGFTLWVVGMNLGTQEEFARPPPRAACETCFLGRNIRTWWSTSTTTSSRAQAGEGSFAFGLDLILDGLERMGSAWAETGATPEQPPAPGRREEAKRPRRARSPAQPSSRKRVASRRPSAGS